MFFKLKQDSLKNNKIARYFVYAFGEVIIVIVGVLLAISFNNYNTYNNADSKAKKYIVNIQEDLLKDTESFKLSLATAEKQLLLLDNYFLKFKNLDTLPLSNIQEIVSLSLAYPYNYRTMNEYLSINQNSFANSRKAMADKVDMINEYYNYCKILDHSTSRSMEQYNKALDFWISQGIDINSGNKELLLSVLSSNKFKNIMFFRKELLKNHIEYYQNCILFNEAIIIEIREFLELYN